MEYKEIYERAAGYHSELLKMLQSNNSNVWTRAREIISETEGTPFLHALTACMVCEMVRLADLKQQQFEENGV